MDNAQVYLKMAEVILQKKIDKDKIKEKLYQADRAADHAEYNLSIIQPSYNLALAQKELCDKELLTTRNIYSNISQELISLEKEFNSYFIKDS